MKPSWDDAPDWAEWLAMDADGEWYWYMQRPKPSIIEGCWITDNRWDGTGIGTDPSARAWDDSAEPRP